jgi:hypothetical protein
MQGVKGHGKRGKKGKRRILKKGVKTQEYLTKTQKQSQIIL